jgi:uncharacterized protein YcfJ
MKKLLTATAITMALASSAMAEATAYANIVNVVTNYKNNGSTRTEAYQLCETKQVPVTRESGTSAGEGALAGMIIGGIIGKGVTGKDNGAAAGAVIGGIIGADKSGKKRTVTTYEEMEVCSTRYREVPNARVVKNYKITYEWNGVQGTSYTYNRYQIGDRIPVTVSINAK